MGVRRLHRALAWIALILLLPIALGCGHKLHLPQVAAQRPVVVLTYAPASSTQPYSYAYQLYWRGFDPDGRIDHYLYCVDPPTAARADTQWITTNENRHFFLFRAGDPDSLGTKAKPGGFHVFVIEAVDNSGLHSEPVVEAFFSNTAAPKVVFVKPKPAELVFPVLPPVTTFTFTGTDVDGHTNQRPIGYRYRLFMDGGSDFDFDTLVVTPDRLRQRYAPTFAEWDSIAGDTCRVQVSGLIPGHEYVFAVVAFDEAGSYSPVFSYSGNLLRFRCEYTGQQGPKISVWNEFFSYAFPSGGYNPDPASYIHVEVPGGRRINFQWSAVAQNGADLKSFRWALDIERLDDETSRTNEGTDWSHWSVPALNTTAATVGPFTGTGPDSLEQHLLFIEAEDSNGLKSLAVVQFHVIRPSFNRPLLFVNDTRFSPDHSKLTWPDSTVAPSGTWPSAAELDTFLFAHGGVRWRYYIPVTTLSPPGIFAGYDFDTIGTRRLPNGILPLSTLMAYRHVVWMGDQATASTQPPYYGSNPMPILEWMSGQSGITNSLETYCLMGGSAWMMGGGVGYASTVPFNVKTNDVGSMTFSAAAGELLPGRLMYDAPHWRSEFALKTPAGAARNPTLPAWSGAPDYAQLPATLDARKPATDPLPPMRSSSSFYQVVYIGEVITQPNEVLEDVGSDPPVQFSMLDTLYFATGGNGGTGKPVMTSYHGNECGSIVFSGFPLWYFQRAQAIRVGDFVMQQIWKLNRAPVPR